MEKMKRHKDMTPEDKLTRLESVQYATGEQRAINNNFRKNEVVGPKGKKPSAMDVSGGKNKAWCSKEQHCIGTWNVRYMNQGKLDIIMEEMARMNIGILGIS